MNYKVILVAASMLSACAASGPGGNRSAEEVALYDHIIGAYGAYAVMRDPKILVGCMNRADGRQSPVQIRQLFAWSTADNSDSPIFVGNLRKGAIDSCREWADSQSTDCECTSIDTNGKNTLDLAPVNAAAEN